MIPFCLSVGCGDPSAAFRDPLLQCEVTDLQFPVEQGWLGGDGLVVRGRLMASLLEKLRAKALESRARVEDLRARIAGLEEELAAEEDRVSRWAVAEEAVAELLAEDDTHIEESAFVAGPAAGPSQAAVAASEGARVVVSAPVTRADGEVLSEANEDVVLALASAGRPLRSKEICEAVGAGTGHRQVEGMRVRLKRLVKQGWLTEDQVGLFAIAPGVGDPAPAETAAGMVNGVAVGEDA